MHRRHYEMIARTLKGMRVAISNQAFAELVERFTTELDQENANFDRVKFAKACGA